MAALLMLTLCADTQNETCDYSEKAVTCLPVQERKQVQYTQARQEMHVNLGHQLALADRLKLRRLRVRLRVIVLAVAIVGRFQLCRKEEPSAPSPQRLVVSCSSSHAQDLNQIAGNYT